MRWKSPSLMKPCCLDAWICARVSLLGFPIIIDALITLKKQIGHLIGKNKNKLFGINGISLRNSEIFINSTKGINCTFNDSLREVWPLGKTVLRNLIHVIFVLVLKKNTCYELQSKLCKT